MLILEGDYHFNTRPFLTSFFGKRILKLAPDYEFINESVDINMFFDNENYLFKLKFLGEEILDTKFGKISSLKFRPYVQSGRVFREQESVTMWVSNDKNKVPLKIQANLAVGSIECDLENFKNLKYPFLINIE